MVREMREGGSSNFGIRERKPAFRMILSSKIIDLSTNELHSLRRVPLTYF